MRKAQPITGGHCVLLLSNAAKLWYSSISKLGGDMLDITTKPQSKINPTAFEQYISLRIHIGCTIV